MKVLILLLGLLALTSCTQKSVTQAKLTVSSQAIFGGSNSVLTAGGLVVWGQGPEGQAFGRVLMGSDQVSLPLLNGNWTFFAMSWEKVSSNLDGKTRCALSSAALTGGSIVLNLPLDLETCTLPVFSNGLHTTSPSISLPFLRLEWCGASPNQVAGPLDRCTDNLVDTTRKAPKGHGASYRFRVRSFDRRPGAMNFLSEAIESMCFDGDSNIGNPDWSSVMNQAGVRLPAGNGGNSTPFHITLDVFLGSTDCDQTVTAPSLRTPVLIELPNGLRSTQPRTKYIVDNAASVKPKLYVEVNEADICTSRLTSTATTPFAAGLGTVTRPYLICSAPQLQAMVGNTIALSSDFKLLRDVDLNPTTKGLSSGGSPTWYTCLEIGGNFLPIGHTCATLSSAAAAFTGTFDGNLKAIRGLRMRFEETINVGLFARITTGEVRNLSLDRPEIGGHQKVGAIAGEVTGDGSKTFRRIEVVSPKIEGREKNGMESLGVGGAFGLFSNANLNLVTVRLMKVRGEGDLNGGIAGSISGANNTMSVFSSGVIEGFDQKTGGIAGEITDSSLSQVRFEGYVSGMSKVGGLGGSLANTSVTHSYANAGVNARHTGSSIYVGGLFGEISGTTSTHQILRSFFTGRIFHRCPSPSPSCYVNEIAGYFSGVTVTDFSTSFFSTNSLSGMATAVGTGYSLSQMFDGSTLDSMTLPGFSYLTGDIPRIPQEAGMVGLPVHPCRLNNASAQVSIQIGSGRGGPANPILICNPDQLEDVSTNLSRSFKLASFVVSDNIPARWGTFSGSLDGDGRGIIGITVAGSMSEDIAWFTDITGSMRNISFFGGKTSSAITQPTVGSTAFLATTVSGSLENLNFFDILWKSDKTGGVLARQIGSTARISKSKFFYRMEVQDGANQGGLASTNSGIIEGVENRGEIEAIGGADLNSFGGFVSVNSGSIRRSENDVRINDNQQTTGTNSALLASVNTGTIEDILQEWAEFRGTSLAASGMVYDNTGGMIKRVFSQAQVRLEGGDPRTGITPTFTISPAGTYFDILYTSPATLKNTASTGLGIISSDATTCTLEKASFKPTPMGVWDVVQTPTSFGILVDGREFFPISSAIYGTTEDEFTVTTGVGCTPSISSATEISLVSSSPAAFGTPVSEANLNDFSTFSTWNGQENEAIWVADMSNPAEESRVLNLYVDYLSGQPLRETPPVWEFSPGEGLRLFNLDD